MDGGRGAGKVGNFSAHVSRSQHELSNITEGDIWGVIQRRSVRCAKAAVKTPRGTFIYPPGNQLSKIKIDHFPLLKYRYQLLK